MKEKLYHRCAFDVCDKRLIDFGFVSHENGNLYCDEICAERDLEQKAEKKSRFLWH